MEASSFSEGLEMALAKARDAAQALCIAGSLYVAGEARHHIFGGPRDPEGPLF